MCNLENMDIDSTESEIVGEWIEQSAGKVVANHSCERIDWLVKYALKEISVNGDSWEILYQNPKDGAYWEMSYPSSHMHGGGPPKLSKLSSALAKEKYGASSNT
jgi:hypothetical protein